MKDAQNAKAAALYPYEGAACPEFHISFRTKGAPMSQRTAIQSSSQAAALCRTIFQADTIEWVESMVLICLSRSNKPLGYYKVGSGGVTGTVADPRVIFQIALLSNAASIIVAHNHPSGNLQPSQEDKKLTAKLSQAGKLLEIALIDHLIITSEAHFSFSDAGELN